jgi:hypothetical protein
MSHTRDMFFVFRNTQSNGFKVLDRHQREIEETVTSFRRAGDYVDPFKKWAVETRTAAFVSGVNAIKKYSIINHAAGGCKTL